MIEEIRLSKLPADNPCKTIASKHSRLLVDPLFNNYPQLLEKCHPTFDNVTKGEPYEDMPGDNRSALKHFKSRKNSI